MKQKVLNKEYGMNAILKNPLVSWVREKISRDNPLPAKISYLNVHISGVVARGSETSWLKLLIFV